MTRAARAWGQLTDQQKERVFTSIRDTLGEDGAQFIRALAADHQLWTNHHGKPRQDALIPQHEAGPRLPAEPCDDCGTDVTTGRIAFYEAGRVLYLGESCWRDRMGLRRRGDDLPGDVQQPFPTPLPIQED